MKNIEKILWILDEIVDIYELEPEDRPICFDLQKLLPVGIGEEDVVKIMEKIEKEEAIRIIRKPEKITMCVLNLGEQPKYNISISKEIVSEKSYLDYYEVEKSVKFNEYYKEIKDKISFLKDKSPPSNTDNFKNSVGDIIYEITYNENREIILNGTFLLAQPNCDEENDLVFRHLINNPNKPIKKHEIEKEIGRKLIKKIPKIINNLGFSGDLRKVFFGSSNQYQFYFRNPIRKEDLDNLGIDRIRIKRK